ncbi:hypothetical protein EDB84DRAFT_1435852 [Lactarius hengduanensis]|nr:hypothetical protein EDB84DRAFT_1435852 [Lactarius hengduanensis]
MARTKQSTRRPLPERIVKIRNEIRSRMCYMSTARSTGAHLTGAHLKKPQKKKAPRRKRKIRDIDLTEEVRDLEREIALSSTSEASKSPPCTKDGRTLHGTQERNEPERGPTMLCARKRRSVSTVQRPVASVPLSSVIAPEVRPKRGHSKDNSHLSLPPPWLLSSKLFLHPLPTITHARAFEHVQRQQKSAIAGWWSGLGARKSENSGQGEGHARLNKVEVEEIKEGAMICVTISSDTSQLTACAELSFCTRHTVRRRVRVRPKAERIPRGVPSEAVRQVPNEVGDLISRRPVGTTAGRSEVESKVAEKGDMKDNRSEAEVASYGTCTIVQY